MRAVHYQATVGSGKAAQCRYPVGLLNIRQRRIVRYVDFEWDPAKSEGTLKNRGFDFGFAAYVFLDPSRLEREGLRRDYGERRYQTIGEIDGLTYFVVFTRRSRRIRIISARRAHDNEDRAYRTRQA